MAFSSIYLLEDAEDRCAFFLQVHNFLKQPVNVDSDKLQQFCRIRDLVSLAPPLNSLHSTTYTYLSTDIDDNYDPPSEYDDKDKDPDYTDGANGDGTKRTDGGRGGRGSGGGAGHGSRGRAGKGGRQAGEGDSVHVDGLASLNDELKTLDVQAMRSIRKV